MAIASPPIPTMADLIEERIRDLMLATESLSDLKVWYRGEPGIVPVRLYPFGIVFLRREREARGEEGFGQETGFTYWRYEGYISVEVLFRDTSTLLPDSNRRANVGSYMQSKDFTQIAKTVLTSWDVQGDPVVTADGTERSVNQMFSDDIVNGIESRTPDNVGNRGNVAFHLYVRKNDFN